MSPSTKSCIAWTIGIAAYLALLAGVIALAASNVRINAVVDLPFEELQQ